MRIILLFILNAGLNLGFGLAVAALLAPSDYGRFAIGMTAAVVLATGAFDWLRLSATRFYGEKRRLAQPELRATLDASYLALAALLVGALAVLLATGVTFGLGRALLAASVVAGIANGVFDFKAALARARFHDRSYALLVGVKTIGSIALGLGAAVLVKDPAGVLVAVAASAILAVLAVRRTLQDRQAPIRLASVKLFRSFADYGLPVVAANVVFQLIVLINRSAAAAGYGYEEAGQLSLATDLGLRLFLAAGAAIDVFVFQLAVRREAELGIRAAEAQLRLNALAVVAVLLLLGIGYALALPAFESLFIPIRYRQSFGPLTLVLLPGLVLFCIGQFAINPLFQIASRTRPVIVAAVVTLVIDAAGVVLAPHGAGVMWIAGVHSGSLAAGALAIFVLAMRSTNLLRPNGDLLRVLLAGAVTAVVLWPLRDVQPAWLALTLQGTAGPASYGAMLWLLDVAGLRAALADRLGALRPRAVQKL